MPAIHEIVDDPIGDLVIKVGTDNRLVRAHRNVLIMSSPVLKTLLAPGQADLAPRRTYFATARQYTESDPLLLQADDWQAFVDLCTVLHQQATGPREIPLRRLPAVAVVAHKYACAERLRSTLASPFHAFFGADMVVDLAGLEEAGLNAIDAICVAFATGDAKLFARATCWATSHTSFRDLAVVPCNGVTSLVPCVIFQHMSAVSERELERLDEAAHQPVLDVYLQTPLKSPCSADVAWMGQLAFHMCKVKKGKLTFRQTMMSLDEVWEAVRSVGEIVGSSPSLEQSWAREMGGRNSGDCLMDVQDVRDVLEEAVEQSVQHVEGLCLRCLKEESLQGLLTCACSVEY